MFFLFLILNVRQDHRCGKAMCMTATGPESNLKTRSNRICHFINVIPCWPVNHIGRHTWKLSYWTEKKVRRKERIHLCSNGKSVIESDINWSQTFSVVMRLYNMAERDPTYSVPEMERWLPWTRGWGGRNAFKMTATLENKRSDTPRDAAGILGKHLFSVPGQKLLCTASAGA